MYQAVAVTVSTTFEGISDVSLRSVWLVVRREFSLRVWQMHAAVAYLLVCAHDMSCYRLVIAWRDVCLDAGRKANSLACNLEESIHIGC